MALHTVDPNDDSYTPGPCEIVETCPICDGAMEAVYSRAHQKVCVCTDCHTSITVPTTAWQVKREKRR